MPSHLCSDPTDTDGHGFVLDVAFDITSRGHDADDSDPGAPPEFNLTSAVDGNGTELLATLSDKEREKLETEISADFDFNQHFRDERDAARDEAWSD
jgi:hypothetical protein